LPSGFPSRSWDPISCSSPRPVGFRSPRPASSAAEGVSFLTISSSGRRRLSTIGPTPSTVYHRPSTVVLVDCRPCVVAHRVARRLLSVGRPGPSVVRPSVDHLSVRRPSVRRHASVSVDCPTIDY
jgi:hypothetical protein